MTSYKPISQVTATHDPSLLDALNMLYSRFHAMNRKVPVFIPSNTCDQSRLTISQQEVHAALSRTKKGKDARHCSQQLAPVLTNPFNMSLQRCLVSTSFKASTVISAPKRSPDHQTVSMKCLEGLVPEYTQIIRFPPPLIHGSLLIGKTDQLRMPFL